MYLDMSTEELAKSWYMYMRARRHINLTMTSRVQVDTWGSFRSCTLVWLHFEMNWNCDIFLHESNASCTVLELYSPAVL